jgi:predicted kinase
MGAPGSGKSTYAAQHNHVVSTDRLVGRVVSRDQVRRVFRQAFDTIEFALSRGREVVLDTTANHPAIRRQAIEVARRHRAGATLLVFNPPVEACLTAQTARRDPVPDEDVRRVHASIRRQLDQLAQEGWDEICVVRE